MSVKFATIVADPPWETMGGPRWCGLAEGFIDTGGSRPLPYESMASSEIEALPISTLAAEDCALYLWTTNGHVTDAYDVARAWGFKPSTLCVWAKNLMGQGLGGAFGLSTEFFLYARRGKPEENRVGGTWFNWKRHYINGKPAHSTKPDAFYDLVEQVSPAPRLELFARRARLGWEYWGDQALQTVEM